MSENERLKKEVDQLRKKISELENGLGVFKEIVDKLPLGVQVFDENGNSFYLNKSQKDFLGLPDLDEGIGKFNVLTDPYSMANGASEIYNAAYKGQWHQHEFEYDLGIEENKWKTHKEKKIYDEVIFPIKEVNNKAKYVVAVLKDISLRKKTEKELQEAIDLAEENLEKHRFLFENTVQGVVYHDSTGNIIYANESAARILGLTLDQLYGKTSMDPRWKSIHEDGSPYPGNTHPVMVTLKTGKPVLNSKMGVFIPQKEGYNWININSIPKFRKGEKKPYLVVVTFEDITEIKDATHELEKAKCLAEESEEKYRQLFENMEQGFALHEMIYDAKNNPIDYRFVMINDAFERLTGLNREYLIGKTVLDLMPDTERIWIENYGKVAKSGIPIQFENYSGELKKHYDVIAYSPKKNFFAVIFTDITKNKNYEQELIVAKERAEKSERKQKEQNAIIELNNRRLESLLKIAQLSETSIQELLDTSLHEAIDLTQSKIGHIYYYNEGTKQFILNTWSKDVMKECAVTNSQTLYDLESTGCWGEAVRQRKPIILNDYGADSPLKKGLPKGHVKLKKFMTIPVFSDKKIVAVAGVANKPSDYDQADVRQLTLLMDNVWKIVERIKLVDELNKAKDRAEESEKNYIGIFNSTGTANSIFNREGVLIKQNEQSVEFLGKEGAGQSVFELFGEKSGEAIWERIKRVFETGIPEVFETKFKLGPEERWFKSTYRPMYNEKHEISAVQVISLDVSDVKRYQNELIEAKESAENSDRLKTAFLQNISHEIRTPMNAIIGFSKLLEDPGIIEEKRNRYTSVIISSTNQLLSIITDVLTIASIDSKQEKLELKEIDLQQIFYDIEAVFSENRINDNVDLIFKFNLEQNQFHIISDKTKVTQVLSNLIANALKFTKKGYVETGCSLKGNCLEFYVKDTGIGIQENERKKIFDRFYQADMNSNRQYGGTGLGLAICKELVEMMNGEIWLESLPGSGSTFYFTIPFKPMGRLGKEDKNSVSEKPNITVLVAEDEYLNYLLIEELLTAKKMKIYHAGNGQEAVDVFRSNNDIDIVLMDIKMPIMEGHVAAQIIKDINGDIPVIAQTAYALSSEISRYEKVFDAYITKPIQADLLLKRIDQLLSQKKEF